MSVAPQHITRLCVEVDKLVRRLEVLHGQVSRGESLTMTETCSLLAAARGVAYEAHHAHASAAMFPDRRLPAGDTVTLEAGDVIRAAGSMAPALSIDTARFLAEHPEAQR